MQYMFTSYAPSVITLQNMFTSVINLAVSSL